MRVLLSNAALDAVAAAEAEAGAASAGPGRYPLVVSLAALDVIRERVRQCSDEGWAPEHDDAHQCGELETAAACYALVASGDPTRRTFHGRFWPFATRDWKPFVRGSSSIDARRCLVKAGALILAAIERLDRAA